MEMQLLFGLGMLTSVLVFGLGYAVVGVFKLTKEVESIQSEISFIYKNYDDAIEVVRREYSQEFAELYRQLDSRLDRLESRITSKISATQEVD
jgi:hypothetical protein